MDLCVQELLDRARSCMQCFCSYMFSFSSRVTWQAGVPISQFGGGKGGQRGNWPLWTETASAVLRHRSADFFLWGTRVPDAKMNIIWDVCFLILQKLSVFSVLLQIYLQKCFCECLVRDIYLCFMLRMLKYRFLNKLVYLIGLWDIHWDGLLIGEK